MSTRFPTSGETTDVPPMPSIPDMPSIPAGAGARLPAQGSRDKTGPGLSIDISQFRNPTFNPDQCMFFSPEQCTKSSVLIRSDGSCGHGVGKLYRRGD